MSMSWPPSSPSPQPSVPMPPAFMPRTVAMGWAPYLSSPLSSPSAPRQSPQTTMSFANPQGLDTAKAFAAVRHSRLLTGRLKAAAGKKVPPLDFQISGGRNNDFNSPQRVMWRERLRSEAKARADKARRQALEHSRRVAATSEPSSDPSIDSDVEMDDDIEAKDDLDDELYKRVMLADRRKESYNARLMYELEVGSSIDPNMEDIDSLERELGADPKPENTSPRPLTADFGIPDDLLLEDDEERLAELYQQHLEGEEDEFANEFDDDLDLQAVRGI